MFIGDYRTAEQAYGSALELLRRSGDHSARLKFTLEKLTQAYLLDNNLKAAEPIFTQLQPLLHTGDHSSRLEQTFSIDLKELANSYERKWNRYHDQKCLEHALEVLQLSYGSNDGKILEETMTLSRIYITQGQVDKGLDLLKRAIVVSEHKFGKDPHILSANLLQDAFECQSVGNYKAADELTMRLIKTANADKGSLRVGLPIFYVFLGTNRLAVGEPGKANAHFSKANQEAVKIRKAQNKAYEKEFLQYYAEPLRRFIANSGGRPSWPVIERELKELEKVAQVAAPDPIFESAILSALGDVLYYEGKGVEAERCLERAIALANHLSAAGRGDDIPEMYLKMANHRAQEHQLDRANQSFALAMEAENGRNGYSTARVLFWWAFRLKTNGQSALAINKLDAALKIARSLPEEKRGNVLADALMLGVSFGNRYTKAPAQALLQELTREIEIQQTIAYKAGTNFARQIDQSIGWMRDVPNRATRLKESKVQVETSYNGAIEAGHFYEKSKQFDNALRAYQAALLKSEPLGADSKEVVTSLANIGYILVKTDQIERATPYHDRILSISNRLREKKPPGKFDAGTCVWINDFADSYHDHAIATTNLRETCAMYAYTLRMAITADHDIMASDIRELATAQFGEGKYLAAESAYECGVNHVKEKWGATHIRMVPDLENLARYQEINKKYDRAADNLRDALGICSGEEVDPAIPLRLASKLLSIDEQLHPKQSIQTPRRQKS
jgi:hypothetical protein